MSKTPGFLLSTIVPAMLLACLAEEHTAGQDKTAGSPLAKPLVDALGDPLPLGAVARCGTVQFRQSGGVCNAVLSGDGKTLVTFGGDTIVYLWEFPSGKLSRKLEGHRYPIANAVLTPDGKKLFASDLTQMILAWDLASGKIVANYDGDKGGGGVSSALVISRDGKLLADVTTKSEVRIRIAETGKVEHLLSSGQSIRGLAFTPDNKSLAVALYGQGIEMWDTATGKRRESFEKSRIPATALVFAADGKSLIVGAEGAIYVFDAANGKILRQMRVNRLRPECLAVSGDGNVVAVPLAGGELSLWNATTGLKLRSWQTDHFGPWPEEPDQVHLSSIAFADGDKMLITTAGGRADGQHVGMWDVATGRPLHSQIGHKAAIDGMAFSRDGKTLASTSSDGTLRLWDPATGLERMRVKADDSRTFLCVAIAPDGKTIATGTQTGFDDRLVQMWDAANGKELLRFATGPKSVAAIAFSSDGKTLATGGPGDTIALWDPATGQARGQLTAKGTRAINTLSFSPDDKMLVSGHDNGEAWVWDLPTGTPLHKLPHTNRAVRVAAFSADGQKVLTAGVEDSARIWQVDEGRELLRCAGHNGSVKGAALSHDGRLLATAGVDGRGIRLWEVASGKPLVGFGETEATFNGLAFSADSKLLISAGSDSCLLVWNLDTVLEKLPSMAAVALSDKEMEALWSDLASADAATGFKAVRILAAVPAQAVPFLRKKADFPAPSKEVNRLVADLDSNEFAVREKATTELLKLDKPAAPVLQRMLDDSSSEEARLRLRYVLGKMGETPLPPSHGLRETRTVETLERIGGKEAKNILETWASQLAKSRIGREAKGALVRMK